MADFLDAIFGDNPWFLVLLVAVLAFCAAIALLDQPAIWGVALIVAIAVAAALGLVLIWRRWRRSGPEAD